MDPFLSSVHVLISSRRLHEGDSVLSLPASLPSLLLRLFLANKGDEPGYEASPHLAFCRLRYGTSDGMMDRDLELRPKALCC